MTKIRAGQGQERVPMWGGQGPLRHGFQEGDALCVSNALLGLYSGALANLLSGGKEPDFKVAFADFCGINTHKWQVLCY